MADLFDYFQTLSTREGTAINDAFICCVKCFKHGINKIFSRNNVKELKNHLLEFHAIVADVTKAPVVKETDSKTSEKDVHIFDSAEQENEIDTVVEAVGSDSETKTEKHDSVWNYFEKNDEGLRICLLCREHQNIITVYGANTASSNLRLHLAIKHGHKIANIRESKLIGKKKPTMSPVWKYFCKPTRHGKVLDDGHVYCGKCLEHEKKVRYMKTTSTTTLRKHLQVVHKIELDVEDNTERPNVTNLDISSILEMSDGECTVKRRAKRVNHTRPVLSNVRLYFTEKEGSEESRWCKLCEEDGQPHKFSRNTSVSTLKRHLMMSHKFDPDADKGNRLHRLQVPLVSDDIPQEIIERATKIVGKNFPKHKHYFISIAPTDPHAYCCFCLAKKVKTGYRSSTSTSNLKLHLEKHHNFTLAPLEECINPEPDQNIVKETADDTLEEEVVKRATEISSTPGLKVKEYFIRLDDTLAQVYCTFCLANRIKYKYSASSSASNLKLHLIKRHKVVDGEIKKKSCVKKEEIPESGDSEPEYHDYAELEHEVVDEEEEEEEEIDEISDHENVSLPTKTIMLKTLPKSSNIRVKPLQKLLIETTPTPKHSTKYCRSCGNSEATFFSKLSNRFEDESLNENLTLRDIYYEITGVAIYVDDGMSQLICYTCEANLKTSYQFKVLANKTEEKMTRHFQIDQPIEYVQINQDPYANVYYASETEYALEETKKRTRQDRSDDDDYKPKIPTKSKKLEPSNSTEFIEEFLEDDSEPFEISRCSYKR